MAISDVQRKRDEVAKQSSFGVPELRLVDGDIVECVFLTTGQDDYIDSAVLHSVPKTTTSTPPKSYWEDEECTGTGCQYCGAGIPKSLQFGVWLWVGTILHARFEPGKNWELIRMPSTKEVYRETVNAPLFWKRGMGQRQYLWTQILDAFDMDGNLQKRIYRITRRGAGKDDTTYSVLRTDSILENIQAYGIPEGLELPTALDVLTRKAKSMSGGDQIVERPVAGAAVEELPPPVIPAQAAPAPAVVAKPADAVEPAAAEQGVLAELDALFKNPGEAK